VRESKGQGYKRYRQALKYVGPFKAREVLTLALLNARADNATGRIEGCIIDTICLGDPPPGLDPAEMRKRRFPRKQSKRNFLRSLDILCDQALFRRAPTPELPEGEVVGVVTRFTSKQKGNVKNDVSAYQINDDALDFWMAKERPAAWDPLPAPKPVFEAITGESLACLVEGVFSGANGGIINDYAYTSGAKICLNAFRAPCPPPPAKKPRVSEAMDGQASGAKSGAESTDVAETAPQVGGARMDPTEVPEASEGAMRTTYRFRAECQADVDRFEAKLATHGCHVEGWTLVSLPHGETAVDFSTDAPLEALRTILATVVDGHVMLETIAPADAYTGERTYAVSGAKPSVTPSPGGAKTAPPDADPAPVALLPQPRVPEKDVTWLALARRVAAERAGNEFAANIVRRLEGGQVRPRPKEALRLVEMAGEIDGIDYLAEQGVRAAPAFLSRRSAPPRPTEFAWETKDEESF
jgi:hypothetical protein